VQELALFYQQQDDGCTSGFSSSISSVMSLQQREYISALKKGAK